MAANLTLRVTVKDAELKQLQAQIDKMKNTTINVKANSGGVDSTTQSVNNLNQATVTTTNSVSDLGSAFVAKVKWGLIQRCVSDSC